MSKAIEDRGFHVDDRGVGAAVALLHGAPSAVTDFEPLISRLARRHRVLVPNFPGYGRTPPPAPAQSSLEALVARLERRLIGAGVLRAALVAFSAGAYKAVAMALRGRIAVSRLILCAPVVGFDPEVADAHRRLAAAVRAGMFDPRPSWLERMASPGFEARDPAGARRVMAWLDAAPLPVVCDELVATADAPDLRLRLHDLTCPVLVCAGSADSAVPVAASEHVARLIPNGIFQRIEGAGHALLIEAPQRMAGLVEQFLAPGSNVS